MALAAAFVAFASASSDNTYPLETSDVSLASNSSVLEEVAAGSDVVIVADAANSSDNPVAATFVIQVTDRRGVTESVQFETATITAGGRMQVGVWWEPKMSGDYVVDFIVVDDLDSPVLLSEMKSATFDVA
jgi:hypothetical protein